MIFCESNEFWNQTLFLDNWWPQFPECFQATVLVFLPCGWLWVTLPFYLCYLYKASSRSIEPSSLYLTKLVLCLALSVVTLCMAAGEFVEGQNLSEQYSLSHYTARGVEVVSFILAALILVLERRSGFITSGILFIFWLLLTVADVIPLYTYIILQKYLSQPVRFSSCAVTYIIIVTQLILHCFAEKRKYRQGENSRVSPEYKASFPSILTFWWMTKLIYAGFKKPITEKELFDLHPRDQGDNVVNEFQMAWKKEAYKYRQRRNFVRKNNIYVNGHVSEKLPLINNTFKADEAKRQKQMSLFNVLFKLYGFSMFKSYLAKFASDLLIFVGPILLSALIDFIEKPEGFGLRAWMGYVIALGMFCVPWCQSVFYHQMYHMSMTLGMRVKTALMSAIYNKAMKLDSEAQRKSTVGEIVNMMAVDCQRIQDAACYTHYVWSIPLQVAIAIYLLWGTMGASSLAGLFVLILLVPVNAAVATKQVQFQKQNLVHKDERIKLTSEVLGGIKVLKLYAWEGSFKDKILNIRNTELDILMKIANLNTLSMFVWTCAPYLVTLATFTSYVLTSDDGYLDAKKAFVTLSLFNILQFPINFIPETISYLAQAAVSIKRIDKFLKNSELNPKNVDKNDFMEMAIKVSKGTFSWGPSLKPVLSNLNIEISEGELVAVVGSVGAGKTSLLSAFLGEMERVHGKVATKGKIAYVPQQAWILNATVRENILFGSDMNKKQYRRVIDACALKDDLQMLSCGDMTEIGEKGVTLSGGQKQRISLARAVYSDADIYLFDDPLSAVDSHVGKHIFKRIISDSGILKHKTRVFVTHAVHWLPLVDIVLLMKEGRVIDNGPYIRLMRTNGQLAEYLHNYYIKQEDVEEEEDPEVKELKVKVWEHVETVTSTSEGANSSDDNIVRQRRIWNNSSDSEQEKPFDVKPQLNMSTRQISHLMEEEKAETGKVQIAVFMAYAKAIGVFSTVLTFLGYGLYQCSSVAADVWLSTWTEDVDLKNTSQSQTQRYISSNHQYLAIYGALGVLQAIFILFYAGLSTRRMVQAARNLHNDMLNTIIRAPMSFFDTTPIGRIVNRFSRDVETIDNVIPQVFSMWILTIFSVASTVLVISISTPLFTTVVIPLVVMYFSIQKCFVPTARQLKRLESVTRSPIFSHFGESIQGAINIRAFDSTDRFIRESRRLIDKNQVYYYAGISANRWLGIWIEFISSCVVFTSALFSLLTPDIDGGTLGLSVTYALQITTSLKWLVRTLSDLETNIVSVERVKEYTEIRKEAEWVIQDHRPPDEWPDEGRLQFQMYSTRYRPELDLVLKTITCDIKPGEKIGIVGRTGAGKSSLVLALFRLVEAVSGLIAVDGRVIEDMGLHDLRSKLTILPQDPVLFSGSLRMNLDPFGLCSDEDLWTALTLAHLKVYVRSLPGGLNFECGEGGLNFSIGQRQLVCLARALLRKTKILILDEATAAVDVMTDNLIQGTVRSEFQDCTIITIAHRINTIMDYDRVMVLEGGKIKEFSQPNVLLQNIHSTFYRLAKDAGVI